MERNPLHLDLLMTDFDTKPTLLPKILIVDDEPVIGELLTYGLQRQYEVTFANDGASAIGHLHRRQDWDVILCDMMMPKTSGMQVYQECKDLVPSLLPRFVFMTGGASTKEAVDFIKANTPKVLEKPFTLRTIRTHLETVLTERGRNIAGENSKQA